MMASMHLSISWLDTLLYMLELVLATYYLAHYVTPRSLKALIYGIMLADTICMITVFAATWTVSDNDEWGDIADAESLYSS